MSLKASSLPAGDTPSSAESAEGTEPTHDGHKEAGDVSSYPEGGLQAWLVAAGTASILFATLGWTNSFGVFFPYYQANQLSDKSPDDIAWIGSVQVTLTFAGG